MLVLSSTTTDKPFRLRFEYRPNYLYVKVQAQTTSFTIAKRYWNEIVAMQHRRRYPFVLIEKDIPGSLHAHDVVMLASDIAGSGVRDVKFAVVDANYDPERCEFEEMVGANRGLQIKMWHSVTEAEAWLSEFREAEFTATAVQSRAHLHAYSEEIF